MRPQQCRHGPPRRWAVAVTTRDPTMARASEPPARLLHWPALTMKLHLALLAALSTLTLHHAAEACGGTFCSNSPIIQNAERVLFIRGGDGDNTAVVQIQAQGNDPSFAWVVPLESVPRNIHEESTSIFGIIDQSTQPTYIFANQQRFSPSGSGFGCGSSDSAAAPLAAPDETAGVRVWASGETGMFRYDVVSSDDPSALRTWLNTNRYLTPPEAEPIIGEYVREQKYFLAVRLSAVQGVSSFLVSPLAFTYTGRSPCVPLRLTRIATTPTLPVLTYIISDTRAVPSNFAQTTVPDAEVARLGPSRFGVTVTYDQVVSTAVQDAGGRAWVTEYAGPLPTNARQFFTVPLQNLIPERPYLTRMYTTVSVAAMDRDPEFDFVSGLPDVSNTHDLSSYSSTASLFDPRLALLGATVFGVARSWRRRRRAAR